MTMETKSESREQQWKDSISQSSSSRSSSITSDSSDGHFDIRLFPLPKPSLSASEAQKQRESRQAYSSSYAGSSWSSVHRNNPSDISGYDPNRIPFSAFSSKPGNSNDWSIASNESLFSIHNGSFSIPTNGLAPAMSLNDIPKEEPVHGITETNPVPLPPVNKPKEPEKETITEKKQDPVEKSDSEINNDDERQEEEKIDLETDDEHKEEEEKDVIEAETETEKPEDKVVEDVKNHKPQHSISTFSHSPSISCASNNSISSFMFPAMPKDDGVDTTPSMEMKENVSRKRRPEYLLPPSPMQPSKPQQQTHPNSEFDTPPKPQPQWKVSKQFESQTQTPKASRKGWFSCFHSPSKCGFFK